MNQPVPDRILASPNGIVSAYFDFARRTAADLSTLDPRDREPLPIAVAIIMLVGAVEAYLNIVGRMWVEQHAEFPHAEKIIEDLDKRRSLDAKLKSWPKLLFGNALDLSSGAPQEFTRLVKTRNKLMHFTTTHESLSYENVTLNGLADITFYASLKPPDLTKAIDTAEETIGALVRLQDGLTEETILLAKTFWTGRPAQPTQ